MKHTFFSRYLNLIPFLVIWLFAIYFFKYSKGEVVLLLNSIHSPYLDVVFTKLSSIGNALSILFFLAIVLWRYNLKYLYFFVLAFVLESLVIIIAKNVFYSHEPRPYLFFETQGILDQVSFVDGVKINKRRSFPSGHTAYSFCMAVFFALKFNKNWVSIFLAIFATLVGMSRMYLVQHFFVDVFTGAMVGIIATSMAFFLVFRTDKKWYNKQIFPQKTTT